MRQITCGGLVVSVATIVVLGACSGDGASSSAGDCPQGAEGCACRDMDPKCQGGLKCLSNLCVEDEEDMPTSTSPNTETSGAIECDANLGGQVDQDGDGAFASDDCDDCDPKKAPLQANQDNFINASGTVCPGDYGTASVVLDAVSGITLSGTNAKIGSLELRYSNGNTLDGFHIGKGGLILTFSEENLITNTEVGVECGDGVHLDDSDQNQLVALSVTGQSILVDVLGTSHNNLFQDGYLTQGDGCGIGGALFFGPSNRIQGFTMTNVYIDGAASGTEILNNVMTGNGGTAVSLGGENSTVNSNNFEDFSVGISVYGSGHEIRYNEFLSTDVCIDVQENEATHNIEVNSCA